MCLATPVKIESRIKNKELRVKVTDNKTVDISLIPDAKVGDWILCHGPLAINKISATEAKNILGMMKKCGHKH